MEYLQKLGEIIKAETLVLVGLVHGNAIVTAGGAKVRIPKNRLGSAVSDGYV